MMAFEAQAYGFLRENVYFKKWIGGAEDNFIIGLARLGFHCGWFQGSDRMSSEKIFFERFEEKEWMSPG